MREPREPPPTAMHEAGLGSVLGDEAVVRLSYCPATWIAIHAMWAVVLGALLAAGYPRARLLVVLGVHLVVWVPLPLAISVRGRRGHDTRRLTAVHVWNTVFGAGLSAAATGGLRSPIAFAMFLSFTVLFSRYGRSRRGLGSVALCCVAVLAMALTPRSWLGPPVADPFFTIAGVVAALGTLGIHYAYLVTLRDTALAALDQAIRAGDELAESALARARDLELVGTRLSHELKNPLGAVKALAQITGRATAEPLTQERLGIIEREVNRMTELVTRELSFTRPLETPRRAPVQLGELVGAVLSSLHGRAAASGVLLRCGGDARVSADAQRLREALFNLVDNAIHACSPGAVVEVSVKEDAGGVQLAVRDGGTGMTEAVLARLGTPFFTTREKGTGLGVVLARAVFEQHGGTLRYRSAPGRGTTAVGSLPKPCAGAPEPPPASARGTRDSLPGS